MQCTSNYTVESSAAQQFGICVAPSYALEYAVASALPIKRAPPPSQQMCDFHLLKLIHKTFNSPFIS